jgi:hypothetical protein
MLNYVDDVYISIVLCLRVVPDAIAAASGGSLLFDQYRPFAIPKPKNRKPWPARNFYVPPRRGRVF